MDINSETKEGYMYTTEYQLYKIYNIGMRCLTLYLDAMWCCGLKKVTVVSSSGSVWPGGRSLEDLPFKSIVMSMTQLRTNMWSSHTFPFQLQSIHLYLYSAESQPDASQNKTLCTIRGPKNSEV